MFQKIGHAIAITFHSKNKMLAVLMFQNWVQIVLISSNWTQTFSWMIDLLLTSRMEGRKEGEKSHT